MITLELPADQKEVVERASEQAGMSIQQYISTLIEQHVMPTDSKNNSMVARIKQMPKPTSFDAKDAVKIQRDLRDEWH